MSNVRKRTFEHVRSAKIQISLRIRSGWSESSLNAFWIVKDAKFLHADNEDWSDCTNTQANLSPHVRRNVFSHCGSFFFFFFFFFFFQCSCIWNGYWYVCVYAALYLLTETLGSSLDYAVRGGRVVRSCRVSYVQLILAYSWARPAILVAGKGRGGMFFISSVSSLSFQFLFLLCPSLSSLLLSLLFSPFLWEMTQNDQQGLTCR